MELPKMYQGNKITGQIAMTTAEMDKVRKIVAEDKVNHGIIATRGIATHFFVDFSRGNVNPEAAILRGVVVSYRKDENNQPYLTHDEAYFIVDKEKNIHGRLSIVKYKQVKADTFFDPIKAQTIVDLGEKGVLSSYNTEETLHYTNKQSLTNFFANLDVSKKPEDASEI